MNDIIQQMLLGQIDMRCFLQIATSDSNLVLAINKLVPEDAINNPEHSVWKKYSYDALKKESFSLWNVIKRYSKFDDSFGENLNVFSIISKFFCFSHIDFIPTTKYEDEFDFLLDVAGESYGGPEVDKIINSIVTEYVYFTPKTKGIREAKAKMAMVFHVVDKKKPRWINGAEWPMGVNSPMQFISIKSINDGKVYQFKDVDTGEIREIVQYY